MQSHPSKKSASTSSASTSKETHWHKLPPDVEQIIFKKLDLKSARNLGETSKSNFAFFRKTPRCAPYTLFFETFDMVYKGKYPELLNIFYQIMLKKSNSKFYENPSKVEIIHDFLRLFSNDIRNKSLDEVLKLQDFHLLSFITILEPKIYEIIYSLNKPTHKRQIIRKTSESEESLDKRIGYLTNTKYLASKFAFNDHHYEFIKNWYNLIELMYKGVSDKYYKDEKMCEVFIAETLGFPKEDLISNLHSSEKRHEIIEKLQMLSHIIYTFRFNYKSTYYEKLVEIEKDLKKTIDSPKLGTYFKNFLKAKKDSKKPTYPTHHEAATADKYFSEIFGMKYDGKNPELLEVFEDYMEEHTTGPYRRLVKNNNNAKLIYNAFLKFYDDYKALSFSELLKLADYQLLSFFFIKVTGLEDWHELLDKHNLNHCFSEDYFERIKKRLGYLTNIKRLLNHMSSSCEQYEFIANLRATIDLKNNQFLEELDKSSEDYKNCSTFLSKTLGSSWEYSTHSLGSSEEKLTESIKKLQIASDLIYTLKFKNNFYYERFLEIKEDLEKSPETTKEKKCTIS